MSSRAARNRATAVAFATCRSTRRWSVRRPRRTRKQSSGPGTPPIAFWRNRSRSAIASSRVTATPRIVSEWPAEVLRRGVEDDVGAERRAGSGGPATRTCCRRRAAAGRSPLCSARSRIVRAAAAMSVSLRFGFDGRLEPDEPGPVGQLLPELRRGRRRGRRTARRRAARPVDPLEIAVRAAVDVVADDDLLAARRELGDRRRRRGTARERDPVRAPLERGDGPLEPVAGRVGAPRVVVAAARPVDAVLGVRRGLVDRRRRRRRSVSSGSAPAWTARVSNASSAAADRSSSAQ